MPSGSIQDLSVNPAPASVVIDMPVFTWRARMWHAVTDRAPVAALETHLHLTVFQYDHESAHSMASGGTFDVTSWPADAPNGTFRTFTVVCDGPTARMYRASDTRELRDGRTW